MTGLKFVLAFTAAYFAVVWFTVWDLPIRDWHPVWRGFAAIFWLVMSIAIYDVAETCFGKSKKRGLPK